MKKIFYLLLLVAFAAGCTQDNYMPSTKISKDKPFELPETANFKCGNNDVPPLVCPEDVYYDLVNTSDQVFGIVTVSNDETNLYVTVTAEDGWLLWNTGFYAGALETVPVDVNGEVDPYQFSLIHSNGSTNEVSYVVPLADLSDCFIISILTKVVQLDANGNILAKEYPWTRDNPFVYSPLWQAGYGEYCKQVCKPDKKPDNGHHNKRHNRPHHHKGHKGGKGGKGGYGGHH